jgi:hypothetical protein
MNKYIIWSDIDVPNEKEYAVEYESYLKDNELQVPENSKDYERGLFEFIYHLNNEYLDDLRTAFNMLCDMPIIVIADLGRWNGRVSGYKMINSCNIQDCFYTDCDYAEWYIDKLGDLRATAIHHDGRNNYLYRVFKSNVTDSQIENLQYKIYCDTVTRADITRVTTRLGDYFADYYGFKINKAKGALKTCINII